MAKKNDVNTWVLKINLDEIAGCGKSDVYSKMCRNVGEEKEHMTEVSTERAGRRRQKEDPIVGLDEVKEVITRMLYARSMPGIKKNKLHNNMIFAGLPGSGKTVMAKHVAGRMKELGISDGTYVYASRADICGQYVGHTAPKVKELFEKAKDGCIFVDEASFLTANDMFVREAVTEFVRFMEERPDVTVIFATYPDEAEKLLKIDPGFASRISRVVRFPKYSDENLYKIFQTMGKSYGVKVEKECGRQFMDYISEIRSNPDFANAREVRKLLETAIEETGMRTGGEGPAVIMAEDVKKASEYLLKSRIPKEKAAYGFVAEQ